MTIPKLSACLTIDFDGLSPFVGLLKSKNRVEISKGEFSAFALPRVLDLLERHEVRATFFVPGHTAVAYPELVQRIRDGGHEIGHHGWVHEDPAAVDADEERRIFERGLEALDRAAGVRPVGYRSPGLAFSPITIDLLLEYGMRYDSSCASTDFTAHYLRNGDQWSTTEAYVFGEVTEIVEIPFSWVLEDYPQFEWVPGMSTGQHTPSEVREIWQAEFDWAHSNVPGGVFDLCLHPEVIGRANRLMMLDALITHMKTKDGVVFQTLAEYVDSWKQENPREQWAAANPTQSGRSALREATSASG